MTQQADNFCFAGFDRSKIITLYKIRFDMEKINIYQAFTRLFGNKNSTNNFNGNITQNGCGKFDDFTKEAFEGIKELGMTHIWFTGIIRHASQTAYVAEGILPDPSTIVKGIAGSPYAIRDYYDVCPDLANNVSARMEEFELLVQRTHDAGLKVIIDFVPNHVSRVYKSECKPLGVKDLGENDRQSDAFNPNNNFYYIPGQPLHLPTIDIRANRGGFYEFPAKVTGNDCFNAHPGINDWFETVKLNYGVDYVNGHVGHFDPIPDTWYKMRDILLFWVTKGVDGFRCDMAEMVPVEFWEWTIPQVRQKQPEVLFIGEIYNPSAYRTYIYRGKFDYLYDKVGLYDTLRQICEGKRSASDITHCWQSVDDIKNHMLNFLENHDEQRLASLHVLGDPFAAIPALVVATCMWNSPFMLYFGQEVGENAPDKEGYSGRDGRTTIFDYWGVKEHQKWMNNGKFDGAELSDQQVRLRNLYKNILNFSSSDSAILHGNFYDLQWANLENWCYDRQNIFSFMRYNEDEVLIFMCNFQPMRKEVCLKIPDDARVLSGLNKLCHIRGEFMDFESEPITFNFQAKDFFVHKHLIESKKVLVYRIFKR